MPDEPLKDIRVIECGQLIAGPFCGQLLADFGADVIKVEPPKVGDPMRQWGRERPDGQSLWWPVLGRNKKSVTCDLRMESGQNILRQLVRHADVLVENFRPGTLERWGLGYDVLSEINPLLVLVRVTGYGQTGPYADRVSFGAIGEAMGGLRHITGDSDRPPSRSGISIGDSLAGMIAAIGALVALHARTGTGRGQVVDAAIYEAVLSVMESLIPEWQIGGYQRERSGGILPKIAPSNAYPTADAQTILIAANQDQMFRRLTEVMNRPELADDPRYATHGARGDHQAELDDHISQWTAAQPAEELLERLHDAGVAAGKIYLASDMVTDPHFAARHAIAWADHPVLGRIAMQDVFPRLSETPGSVRWLGPELGQDNKEIYQGLLGLDEAAMDELTEAGAI